MKFPKDTDSGLKYLKKLPVSTVLLLDFLGMGRYRNLQHHLLTIETL